MAKPSLIELPDGTPVPVVYEDRSVMVLDKPAEWLVAPDDWIQTGRNLFLALREGIDLGDWWARSRNLRFLRFVHRLDADTSGLLMCIKSEGAMAAYSRLFAGREVEKVYLAVVEGSPRDESWSRHDLLGPDEHRRGRQRVDSRGGKDATTHFRVLARSRDRALVEARPLTGRTHQIRLHLLASGYPVAGDELYGRPEIEGLGLRAVGLGYVDPFRRQPVWIQAPVDEFCSRFGFASSAVGDLRRGGRAQATSASVPPPPSSPSRGTTDGTTRRPSTRSTPPGPSADGSGRTS